jgi:Ricin-type beta-trefoil lectin domain
VIGVTADALQSAGTKEMAMRLRRLAGLLAAAALAAGMSVGTGVAAQAATAQPAAAAAVSPSPGSTGAWYEIYAPLIDHSGYYRCLDVPEASTAQYQAIQTYHCHGYASNGANQRWRFWPNADGSYQIQNVNSQLCLEMVLYGSEPVSGSGPVYQNYCDNYPEEDWRIVSANGIQFVLQNVELSQLCAAVSDLSGDSSPIIKQACNLGYAQQLWQLG